MKWIHHDCKERQKFASSLMEVIRFQDMTPAQVDNLKKYPVCPEVQKAFDISNRIPQPGQKRPDKGRKLASHRKSDTGLQKTSDSGGAKSHRNTHNANRMSRRSSDTSTLGKNLLRAERRKRNLSKVPHRARSDTVHSSDFNLKALEHGSFAGEEMVVAVLGGLAVDSKGANRESNAIVKYVPKESKWTLSGKLPSKRYGHLAAVTKGYLYIIGGFEVSRDKCHIPTGTCNRYSFSKGCWDKVASLKYPRCHHGVTVVLGQIYAVGGQSVESLFMDSVEAYDPGSDKWSSLTPLCCARMAANAIEFKDQMYVVGGLMVVPGHKRKVCIVPDTMCFNPQTDTWHHRAALPLPMCNSSLVVHNDRLFAFGGLVRTVTQDKSQPLTPISDVLEYTPGTDTWILVTSMPTPCHSSCLASLGDDIYVLGGQLEDDAATATKASYRYNPSTDRWLALPPLPSRLSQSCAVTLRRDVFE
ncbi:Kelch domain-containing protein, putative [Ixodes scapularis]|uniref:Kelch domain-containing protein, putative n=1 Tax=Ixodes scapularis TaxID=6945 RepID=B7QK30_IXOSC|nr:Kelch domain-containing protein, putative [Ixodes scapularis]|eukprot:XP_002415537.1 Kelch domain-containing protein, putative [Ixodes scapularis]